MKRSRGDDHPDGTLVLLDGAGTEVLVVPIEVAEQLRLLIGRLRLNEVGDVPEVLGVISSLGGEGATTVARGLALVLSNDAGRRVCVVDLNWWSPGWWPDDTEALGGIAEVIAAGAPLDAVLVHAGSPGLTLLPAGATALAERPLLANSAEIDRVLVELRERFDHVIVDLPAVAVTSDALTLAERVAPLLLVVQHGVTTDADVRSAMERLTGIPILGTVFNRHQSKMPGFVRNRLPAV